MDYGKNLKKIRLEKSLTQAETAKSIGLKRSTYKEYELQNSIMPIIHLNSFSILLDVSIDYIFGFSNLKKYSNCRDFNKEESGKRLKEFRKENKLTQLKLAEVLNTTQSVIADYERGRYTVATPFLYTICEKYKISADYLLGRVDEPKYLK